ncbi:hypothetical protein [Rhizobium laguerreae]|uniref:hypothetical protein n=1 Tax=Rhizobium laguerreae TaxID=1076926 RepID=UPI001C9187EE|nr:hypothetical protein [Rhizobium laguerreae]MBY3389200.1 hypothetical protein [Rhizobium laguerreae]MBY3402951.1 hypothetical protein [Rhizobium laguerreae]MBY3409890.1 hypothetical protein [Rhizobium laguerreae]
MTNDPHMSPRIQDLRDYLVRNMPIQKAADRATLGGKYITTVLIHYLTYKARMIRARPRTVVIWPSVENSKHYAAHEADVARLKAEFEAGVDMNAALSSAIRRSVYAGELPQRTREMTNEDWVKKAWRGKDRIRVLFDVHHLHLGPRQQDGSVGRTGPLLFVGVAPEQVFFLTLGDHDSFDDGTISSIVWDALEARAQADGGGIYMPPGGGVTLGGTKTTDTFKAINIVKALEHLDRQIDELGAVDTVIRFDGDDIILKDGQDNETDRFKDQLL